MKDYKSMLDIKRLYRIFLSRDSMKLATRKRGNNTKFSSEINTSDVDTVNDTKNIKDFPQPKKDNKFIYDNEINYLNYKLRNSFDFK